MAGRGAYLKLRSNDLRKGVMPWTRRTLIFGAAFAGLIVGAGAPASWADKPAHAFQVRAVAAGTGAVKLLPRVLVSADMVRSAYPASDAAGKTVLRIEFNDEGRRRLADYTTTHVGGRVAFVVGGEVLAAPVILDPMTGGKAELSGQHSPRTWRALAEAFPDPRWTALKWR
jgi:hypothetical protein